MNKQTLVKSIALTSLVAVGATACTPFQANTMDTGHSHKAMSGGCGGSCGGDKMKDGSCGDKMKDGSCGDKMKDGSCGSH